jgi:hypothetical protein
LVKRQNKLCKFLSWIWFSSEQISGWCKKLFIRFLCEEVKDFFEKKW